MLVVVQFPFADARRFVEGVSQPLSQPSWPAPVSREFVRGFGQIRKRRDCIDWIPEPFVCGAQNALRIQCVDVQKATGARACRLKMVSSRVFFDGMAMGKVELVLLPSSRYVPAPSSLQRRDFLQAVADATARIVIPYGNPSALKRPLGEYVKILPLQWIGATSRRGDMRIAGNRRTWVASGPPMIVVCTSGRQPFRSSATDSQWPIPTGRPSQDGQLLATYSNRPSQPLGDLWTISGSESMPRETRAVRVALCRLHAETAALRLVLKFIGSDSFAISPRSHQSDYLQEYLQKSAVRILRLVSRKGHYPASLLNSVHRIHCESTEAERNVVLDRLRNMLCIRNNVLSNVKKVLDSIEPGQRSSDERMQVVNNYKIDVKGDKAKIVATMGENAKMENVQINQMGAATLDLPLLAKELRQLLTAVGSIEVANDKQEEVTAVEEAAIQAEAENESGALAALKGAGNWILEFATSLGLAVAAAAIKKQLGV